MSNPPRSAASLSSDSTLGCTRSIIGFGYTPVNTMMPMNTDSTRPSRSVSSLNVEFSSSGSPWNTRWYAQSRYRAARITPAAATTVHQRADAERPDEDEELADESVEPGHTDRREHHDREPGGEDRGDRLDALERADLAGVAALVDPADQDEQCAGGDAVVDHLQHAAGDRLVRERERAEHDEAEVGDRRVGDEPLEVLLHRGDDGAVGDPDDGEREQQRPGPVGRLGEEVDAEPEQAVRAELQHHAGQDHRAGGRGLRVGVGQPGVQRERRHLDEERDGEREEQPAPGGRRERGVLGELLRGRT